MFIGSMCKICVSLFAFGTGFGLVNKNVNLKYIKEKILKIMYIYWSALVLFIVFGLIGGNKFDFINVTENILLIKTDINHAAWYLPFYVLALVTILFLKRVNLSFITWGIFCCLCWEINYLSANVWEPISNYFIYMSVVLSGFVCARSKIVRRLLEKVYSIGKKGVLISFVVFSIAAGMRVITGSELKGFRFIWIYTPFIYITLAVLVKYIAQNRIINLIMNSLAKYSTYFLLTNAIFTTSIYWVQYIGFLPKISALIVVWQIGILTCIARLFMLFTEKIRYRLGECSG